MSKLSSKVYRAYCKMKYGSVKAADLPEAERAELKRVGIKMTDYGGYYLPAVPFRNWPMLKLGWIGFKGPVMFVKYGEYWKKYSLMYWQVGGHWKFWKSYLKCRVLGKNHKFAPVFQFDSSKPRTVYKCRICGLKEGDAG